MRKGLMLLCMIVVGVCVLQGCSYPGPSSPPKAGGFPVGHDMHPGADPQKKQFEDETHPLKGYS